jgi:hypothetical protein
MKIVSMVGVCAILAIGGGCSSTPPRYQGASPSLRSVSGAQDTKTSYVGMNFKFAVDRPTEYHRPANSDLATASVE